MSMGEEPIEIELDDGPSVHMHSRLEEDMEDEQRCRETKRWNECEDCHIAWLARSVTMTCELIDTPVFGTARPSGDACSLARHPSTLPRLPPSLTPHLTLPPHHLPARPQPQAGRAHEDVLRHHPHTRRLPPSLPIPGLPPFTLAKLAPIAQHGTSHVFHDTHPPTTNQPTHLLLVHHHTHADTLPRPVQWRTRRSISPRYVPCIVHACLHCGNSPATGERNHGPRSPVAG